MAERRQVDADALRHFTEFAYTSHSERGILPCRNGIAARIEPDRLIAGLGMDGERGQPVRLEAVDGHVTRLLPVPKSGGEGRAAGHDAAHLIGRGCGRDSKACVFGAVADQESEVAKPKTTARKSARRTVRMV